MKKIFILSSLIFALTLSVFADGARTPIYDTTPITQPGHYYLTRNIASSSDPVISIAANDVTLDLNGFLISSPITANTLIEFSGFSNVTVLNGRLSGGATGIFQSNTTEARVHIENIEIRNVQARAIDINKARYVEVFNCHILNPGTAAIYVHGFDDAFSGKFMGNSIENAGSDGINLVGTRGVEVRNNTIKTFAINEFSAAIYLFDWVSLALQTKG